MSIPLVTRTSMTLIERIRKSPRDKIAWKDFVDRYGPRIYTWCLRWHLQKADAEDVTQIVLVKLAEKMRHVRLRSLSELPGLAEDCDTPRLAGLRGQPTHRPARQR